MIRISIIKNYAKTKIESKVPFEIPGFQQGGVLPRTGLYYGHGGERVLTKEDTRSYEAGGVTINFYTTGNIIGDKQAFDDFAEQIDYVINKRNKRTYT